jgi:hypothetical protein
MNIQFNIQSISDTEKQSIISLLETDAGLYVAQLEKFGLKNSFDYNNYEYILNDKNFGCFVDAQIIPDRNQIVFFGKEAMKFLSHEWTHMTFPLFTCDRHAEGLANFIQKAVSVDNYEIFGFKTARELIGSFLDSSHFKYIENWFGFIQNGSNFYDSRLGKFYLSRAISSEFINYIITEIGMQSYMKLFYTSIKNNDETNDLETSMFADFISKLLNDIKPDYDINAFFEVKSEILRKYSKYNIPETGSVLGYLYRTKEKLSVNDYDSIRDIALYDLKENIEQYI